MSSFKFGNIVRKRTNIVSAAGTTILFNNSAYYQNITGSTTQTIQLPDAMTMPLAMGFMIVNSSSGLVTVKNNGGTTLATLTAGQSSEFVTDDISTSNGIWLVVTGAGGGGGGGGTTTYTATAGENLSANDAIYICSTSSDGGRTVGQAYKLDVTNPLRAIFAGFATAAVLSGASASIQVDDELSGFSGVPVGLQIWASLLVPGGFQTTQPDPNFYLVVPLGQGSTTTGKLLINGALYATSSGTIPSTLLAGYVAGGTTNNDISGLLNTISKVTFATDAVSVLSATVSGNRTHVVTVSGSTKGYFCGGLTGGYTTAINAFTFSGETNALLGTTLPHNTGNGGGVQSATKGYLLGAYINDGTVIQTITFAGETVADLGSTLPVNTLLSNTASATSSLAGYNFGNGVYNTISKIVFSSEVTSLLGATMPSGRSNPQPVSSSSKSYITGGFSGGGGTNIIQAFTFSGEASSTLGATLTVSKADGGYASSNSFGYILGGTDSGSSPQTEVEKFNFSTETSAVNSSSMATATRFNQGGVIH